MKNSVKTLLITGAVLLGVGTGSAKAQTLDFFSGVELDYQNIFHNDRVFDVNFSLTPGFKWTPGYNWTITAQAVLPIVHDYGPSTVYLNVASISKEIALGEHNFLKISGGIFTNERYGLDLKWMFPVSDIFCVDAQIGYTGYLSMVDGWRCSTPDRLSGWLRGRMYIPSADTELIAQIGRYAYADFGLQLEWLRHFKAASVGMFAMYDLGSNINLGFRIVIGIPSSWRAGKKVGIRPANNFSLKQNVLAKSHFMTTYNTDPEDNCRDGYFSIEGSEWGFKAKK